MAAVQPTPFETPQGCPYVRSNISSSPPLMRRLVVVKGGGGGCTSSSSSSSSSAALQQDRNNDRTTFLPCLPSSLYLPTNASAVGYPKMRVTQRRGQLFRLQQRRENEEDTTFIGTTLNKNPELSLELSQPPSKVSKTSINRSPRSSMMKLHISSEDSRSSSSSYHPHQYQSNICLRKNLFQINTDDEK